MVMKVKTRHFSGSRSVATVDGTTHDVPQRAVDWVDVVEPVGTNLRFTTASNDGIVSNITKLKVNGTGEANIDWGNGDVETVTLNNEEQLLSKEYGDSQEYTINIEASDLQQVDYDDTSSAYVKAIESFGEVGLKKVNLAGPTLGARYEAIPNSIPSTLEDISGLFLKHGQVPTDAVNEWDLSNIRNMNSTFESSKVNGLRVSNTTLSVTTAEELFKDFISGNVLFENVVFENLTSLTNVFDSIRDSIIVFRNCQFPVLTDVTGAFANISNTTVSFETCTFDALTTTQGMFEGIKNGSNVRMTDGTAPLLTNITEMFLSHNGADIEITGFANSEIGQMDRAFQGDDTDLDEYSRATIYVNAFDLSNGVTARSLFRYAKNADINFGASSTEMVYTDLTRYLEHTRNLTVDFHGATLAVDAELSDLLNQAKALDVRMNDWKALGFARFYNSFTVAGTAQEPTRVEFNNFDASATGFTNTSICAGATYLNLEMLNLKCGPVAGLENFFGSLSTGSSIDATGWDLSTANANYGDCDLTRIFSDVSVGVTVIADNWVIPENARWGVTDNSIFYNAGSPNTDAASGDYAIISARNWTTNQWLQNGLLSDIARAKIDLTGWSIPTGTNLGTLFYQNTYPTELSEGEVNLSNWDIATSDLELAFSFGYLAKVDVTGWTLPAGVAPQLTSTFANYLGNITGLGTWTLPASGEFNGTFANIEDTATGFGDVSNWTVSPLRLRNTFRNYKGAGGVPNITSWDTASTLEMNSLFEGANEITWDLATLNVDSCFNFVYMVDKLEVGLTNTDLTAWDVYFDQDIEVPAGWETFYQEPTNQLPTRWEIPNAGAYIAEPWNPDQDGSTTGQVDELNGKTFMFDLENNEYKLPWMDQPEQWFARPGEITTPLDMHFVVKNSSNSEGYGVMSVDVTDVPEGASQKLYRNDGALFENANYIEGRFNADIRVDDGSNIDFSINFRMPDGTYDPADTPDPSIAILSINSEWPDGSIQRNNIIPAPWGTAVDYAGTELNTLDHFVISGEDNTWTSTNGIVSEWASVHREVTADVEYMLEVTDTTTGGTGAFLIEEDRGFRSGGEIDWKEVYDFNYNRWEDFERALRFKPEFSVTPTDGTVVFTLHMRRKGETTETVTTFTYDYAAAVEPPGDPILMPWGNPVETEMYMTVDMLDNIYSTEGGGNPQTWFSDGTPGTEFDIKVELGGVTGSISTDTLSPNGFYIKNFGQWYEGIESDSLKWVHGSIDSLSDGESITFNVTMQEAGKPSTANTFDLKFVPVPVGQAVDLAPWAPDPETPMVLRIGQYMPYIYLDNNNGMNEYSIEDTVDVITEGPWFPPDTLQMEELELKFDITDWSSGWVEGITLFGTQFGEWTAPFRYNEGEFVLANTSAQAGDYALLEFTIRLASNPSTEQTFKIRLEVTEDYVPSGGGQTGPE